MKATTLVLAIGLCGAGQCPREDEQRAGLARQMTDVTAAAESIAHERPELSGAQVLAEMRRDPDVGPLLGGFAAYRLQVLARGGHAVVLLCREDGSLVLLEDSACTPTIDRDESAAPGRACAFSLDPVAACTR